MCTGDLLGSGTISGPDKGSYGSLLELTWGGKEVLALPGGATRTFLEDGDTAVLRWKHGSWQERSLDEVAETTTHNAVRLFGLA